MFAQQVHGLSCNCPANCPAHFVLQVFAKALDKTEHECEGYTFSPCINPLSRQLALANYAVAPDPARPWTLEPTSPDGRSGHTHNSSSSSVKTCLSDC
jgi:hypothetical protein